MKNRYKLPVFSLLALSLCGNVNSSKMAEISKTQKNLQLKDIGTSTWTPPVVQPGVIRPTLLHTVFVTAYKDTLALVNPETYASAHHLSLAELKENSLGMATMTLGAKRELSIRGIQLKPVVAIEWEGDEYSAFGASKERDVVLQKEKFMVMNYDKTLHGPITESYNELVQKYRPMPPMMPVLALKAE